MFDAIRAGSASLSWWDLLLSHRRCFLFRICGGDIEGTREVCGVSSSIPVQPGLCFSWVGWLVWCKCTEVGYTSWFSPSRLRGGGWIPTHSPFPPSTSPPSVHTIGRRPRCFPPAPSPALLHCTTISKQGVCLLSPSPLATITTMYVHARSDGTPLDRIRSASDASGRQPSRTLRGR